MKRIALMFAIMVIAGIGQAAQLQWGGQALDASSVALVSGQAYLVYCGANGTLDATYDANTDTWVMGPDDVVVDSTGYFATTSAGGYYSATATVGTPVNAVYAVIITDNGVAGTTLPTYAVEGNGFYGATAAGDVYKQEESGELGKNTAVFPTINATDPIAPIPEPTTVALALVGVAAVALRRKFMKK